MDPPAAIPAESTAGTGTESHRTEPGRDRAAFESLLYFPGRLR